MAGVDGTRLRERNRSSTVTVVRRAALDLMERRGFEGVTVAEIAAEAGVSPSTVYRHFGTKEALVLSGDVIDELVPALVAAEREDRKAAPADIFGRATRSMLRAVDHDDLLRRLQLVFADPALTAAIEHGILGRRDDLADLFAMHRKATSRGVRDDAAAGALLGMFVAVLDRWQRTGGEKSLFKMLAKATASLG